MLAIGPLTSPEIFCLDKPPKSNNGCYYKLYLVALTPKVILKFTELQLLNPLWVSSIEATRKLFFNQF